MYVETKALMSYSESYNKELSWLMQISHINMIWIRYEKGLNYKPNSHIGDTYLIFACVH